MVRLFEPLEVEQKIIFLLTELETRSAIRRRLGIGNLSIDNARTAVAALSDELRHIDIQDLTSALRQAAIKVVDRQNIRALDALQLTAALTAKETLTQSDHLLFVASDDKLLRAAMREGLEIWNHAIDNPVPPQPRI